MNLIDKNIFELVDEISNQIEYLKKFKEKYNNLDVKYYEFTILNFISRSKNNLKGLKLLLEQVPSDEFLLVPINSIMRTISSDGVTLSYLMSFLSNDLNETQETFLNELYSISTEHFHILKEFDPDFVNKFYFDEDLNIKKRRDFHKNSNLDIIGDFKLSTNSFLSEKHKLSRINYALDEKKGMFQLKEIQNSDIKKSVITCYETNKWFSQYYHYNHLNSQYSTTKTDNDIFCETQQISSCVKSSFSILSIFINYLN